MYIFCKCGSLTVGVSNMCWPVFVIFYLSGAAGRL